MTSIKATDIEGCDIQRNVRKYTSRNEFLKE